jgi:WD repeat-containing protein 55
LRVIELLPTRLVGVIADHGDFPIERIAIDHAGEGRWVGSVGHDEVLRLTDLREVLEDEDERDAKAEKDGDGEGDTSGDEGDEGAQPDLSLAKSEAAYEDGSGEEQESGDESDVPKPRKRRKKDEGDLKGRSQKKGRNQVDVDPSFFSGL